MSLENAAKPLSFFPYLFLPMRENQARTKLQKGQPIFGVISPTTDPVITEYCGLAGFDFYMLDGEHGAITPSNADGMIRAAESVGITPLARVRSLDEKLILQFMDLGVMGVMMPGCNTAEDCEKLVRAMKYPPLGERGLGPVRASDYMLGKKSQLEYVNFANEQTLVLPQIEDIKAMDNLEAMCKVKGVDGFVIGPRDLAMTMGFYDGPAHDEVKKVIDQIFEIVLRHNLVLGTVAATKEQAQGLIQKGARIILNSVAGLLSQSSKAFLS
ncbi:MAG: aldolase/citrate lyase family protein [Candidatus Kapabacteria bacterium]|jgi:4-hydroxy-2-oxoheptanedioate aldolase|nr:aldolase/citrate lyase family protein [Candidatus Kapabacteria bacterium]